MDDELLREMFRSRDAAVAVALETLDKRLEGMNEFRETISDQSARMATKDELRSAINLIEVSTTTDISFLRERVAGVGHPDYLMITGVATILFAAIAGLWLILGLRIDGGIAPMALQMENFRSTQTQIQQGVSAASGERQRLLTLAEASTAADQVSAADRRQLNERLRDIEGVAQARAALVTDVINLKQLYATIVDRLVAIRTDQAKQLAALTEVETQFCEGDTVRNLTHSNDLRLFSMLWRKTFADTVFPTDNAYYPSICNRPSTQ